MKAAFTQAGSSSKGAGRGVRQRPLHPEALSVSPCASLLPSSLVKLKPMCSQLPFSPVPLLWGSGLGIRGQPQGPSQPAQAKQLSPQCAALLLPLSPAAWAPSAEALCLGLSPP